MHENVVEVKLENDVEKQLQYKRDNPYTFARLCDTASQETIEQCLSFSPTDYGNAQAMSLLFKNCFVKTSGYGLLYYNGKFWNRDFAEDLLVVAAIETLKVRQRGLNRIGDNSELRKKTALNTANIHNLARLFSENAHEFITILDSKDFNANAHLLNLNNGVLDLRTGQLLEHDSQHYFTCCSDVNWNPNADSSKFEEFLSQVMLDWDKPEHKIYIQKLLGYCLTGETNMEKIIYHYGAMGRNGKGTLAYVIKHLMNKLSGAAPFATFTRKREGNDQGFDLAPLHDKRVIIASESDKRSKLNEAMVKNVSGNDELTASFKGKDQFNFLPKWKINLFSNYQPKGDAHDKAFWSRFYMVIYPNSYIGREDFNLKHTLVEPDNLEGALRWFVTGAMMYYADGKVIETPSAFVQVLENYRSESDTVKKWLDENTINMFQDFDSLPDETQVETLALLAKNGYEWADFRLSVLNSKATRTTYDELYSDYKAFCVTAEEEYPLGKANFLDALRIKGYIDKTKCKVDGKTKNAFEGIFLFQGAGDFVESLQVLLKCGGYAFANMPKDT